MAWPVQKALKDATIPGFPVVDRTGRTTIRGVWVAGNAADPRAQVITSAGSGSAAAIAINADLVQEDIVTAVHGTFSTGERRPCQVQGSEPPRRCSGRSGATPLS